MGLRDTGTTNKHGRFAVFCFPFAPQHCIIGSSGCVQTSEAGQKTDVFHTISSQIMRLLPCMLLAPCYFLQSTMREIQWRKDKCKLFCFCKSTKNSTRSKEVFLQIQKVLPLKGARWVKGAKQHVKYFTHTCQAVITAIKGHFFFVKNSW